MKETLKDLKDFELVIPARDLLDAIVVSADAYSEKPMDENRARNMRLTLGFLNAYLKAFHTKVSYFKLTEVPKKVRMVQKFSNKRR